MIDIERINFWNNDKPQTLTDRLLCLEYKLTEQYLKKYAKSITQQKDDKNTQRGESPKQSV